MLADVRYGSKADMTALSRDVRYTPNSGQTQSQSVCPLSANSCREHVQQTMRLFDHLVGAGEYGRRDFEAQRFGRLEVNHRLKFSWRLHRQITWLLSL
jgi:hypothetical protein